MRLITISGGKHTPKDIIAMRLSRNSDCVWIKPYTDKSVPVNLEDSEQDMYYHLSSEALERKMVDEEVIAESIFGDNRYVFFEYQLTANYCVLVADDDVVTYLKNNWLGDMITIRLHSKNEEYSERNLLPDKEFDIVFNTDYDDLDELEELVGDIYHFKG